MLPVDNAARPVLPVESNAPLSPTGDARQEAFQRASRQLIGQELVADIRSRLQDGTYLVKIAGINARMMLPAGVQVGTLLPMTLVSADPKPTFVVGPQSGGQQFSGSPGQQATLLAPDTSLPELFTSLQNRLASDLTAGDKGMYAGQHNKIALSELDKTFPSAQPSVRPAVESDPHTFFSTAGKLIGNLLYVAQQSGAPASLVGKTPLLNSPSTASEQIATTLRDTLTYSGLFYESHIVEWADGKRSLTDLLREPQATLIAADDAARSAPSSATSGNGAVTPELAQLVNLQLNTLEQNRTQWNGEIWPGQPMQWAVSKDDKDGNGHEAKDDADAAWNSSVQFNLPHLGAVSATIHLQGEHIRIQVTTPSEQVATSLRRFGPRLAQALDAAGSPLDSLIVKHDSQE